MDIKKILSACDHTLLAQDASEEEIRALCEDAVKYQTASVCIPPSFVKLAKDCLDGKVKLCTVIGFPLGYSTTRVKVLETEIAVSE